MALSDFQTIQRLGQGAHGHVHEVVHVPTGRHFALKIFHTEAATSSLSDADHRLIPRHPGVLPLLASGVDEHGRRWQAFPLLRPENARRIVEKGGASAALSLLTQAASGLSHLHEQGIIVADLKPDNLLVESTGRPNSWQSSRLVISDLDLACPIGSNESRLAGTRGYLAPELLDSRGGVTTSSDVFALGAWLVWLISGQEPFTSELNPARLTHRIQVEMGNPTGRSDPRFAGARWAHLLTKVLDPDPGSRLRDGRQLLEFLSMMASHDDDWSRAMPALIRNPFVGSPANDELRNRLRGDRNEIGECDVVIIQPDPAIQFDEFLEGILADLGWSEAVPIVIEPGRHRDELLKTITGEPGRPIVLNWLGSSGGLLVGIEETLELIRLARRSDAVQHHPVLCLVSLGQDVGESGFFGQGGEVRVYRALTVDNASLRRWLPGCFTSRPLEATVMDRLRRRGALHPSGVLALIGLADAREGLTMVSGEVGLFESSADDLVAEAARASSGDPQLSEAARELRVVLGAVPGGLDPKWLTGGNGDMRWSVAARQLEALGLVHTRRDEVRGLRLQVNRSLDAPPGDRLSLPGDHLLRLLLDNAARAGTAEQDESLIAIRFLARADDPAGHRRGRALARLLAARGEYPMLARLLEMKRTRHPPAGRGVVDVLDLVFEAVARVRSDSFDTARPLFERALEEARHTRVDWLVVRTALTWSMVQFEYGYREPAAASLEECLAVVGASARVPRQLRAGVSLHVIRMRINDLIDPDVVRHFRLIDEDPMAPRSAKAVALAKWGRRLFAMGDGGGARACFSRAMRLVRHSRQFDVVGSAIAPLAIYHFRRGHLGRASRLFKLLEMLPKDQLALSDRIACLSGTGALAYEQGLVRKAYDVNVHLYELAKRIGHSILQTSAAQNLGHLLHLMHHPAQSRHYLSESIRLGRGMAAGSWRLAITHLAECELEIGRHGEAEALLREIGERGNAGSSELTWGFARRLLGRIRIQSGARLEGRQLLEEALGIFEGLKAADEVLITRLDCFPLDFGSASNVESDAALEALEREAAGLRSWRIQTMVRLARLKKNVLSEDPGFEAELRALIRDALDRGFVSLEVDALRLLIERLIGQGWINEAQDAMKAALARIKAAADGFTQPELKRAYLASPGRQSFLELSARIGKAQKM